MKIINIDVKDKIELKNIEDSKSGQIKFIKSTIEIPTDNYNNLLLNFNFISPSMVDGLHFFAIFSAKHLDNPIAVDLRNLKVDDVPYKTACLIPVEVLKKTNIVNLGIYGYVLNEDGTFDKRISLKPVAFSVVNGSYDENAIEPIEVPEPTIFEIYFDKIETMTTELETLKTNTEKDLNTLKTTTENDINAFKTNAENELNTLKDTTENDINTFKNETAEEMEDYKWGVPAGSVIGFNGDTIPEGYEEVDNPNVYSTEEKVIGEFLGKPLYRKVYEGTLASSGGVTNIDSNFTNKNIVHRYGEIKCDTNNANSIQIGCYVNGNYYSGSYLYGSTLYIYHPANSNFYNKPYYLIVEYTKTTD